MPFHFCADELFMLMAMIPFIGIFFRKVHAWWHTKFKHAPHPQKSCCGEDHPHLDASTPILTKEDMDAERKKIANYEF